MMGVNEKNAGLSLVELLVAFAVSAIVLAGLGFLLIHVLNLSARTNANVELQNESQTAMNLVMDNLMDATGLCMIEADTVPTANDTGNQPVCVLLGELVIQEASYDKTSFAGDAIIWDPVTAEMYLRSYEAPTELDTSGSASESEAAVRSLQQVQKEVLDLSREERLPYLMARNVTVFDLRPARYYSFPPSENRPDPEHPGATREVYYFANPMIFELKMEFEIEYQIDRKLSRQMEDEAAIRNRLAYMYMQRTGGGGMLKYYCK